MKLKSLTYAVAVLIFFSACATQVAPGGGPEDKLPPRIAGVYPAPNTTNHPSELYVKLEFDEWINPTIPRSAVSISPPIEKKMRFEVSGKTLELTSKAKLDTGTTYTITFAGGIKDLHSNSLAAPFQVVFSTGSSIDSLKLFGRVMVNDTMIRKGLFPSVGLFLMGAERNAYHYLDKYKDSVTKQLDSLPMLAKEPPLFLTRADSMGNFTLTGLKPGRYRVAAFVDANGNQKIEPSAELAGFIGNDIVLTKEKSDTLWIPLADQDTSLLELQSVSQPFANILEASFTRPVYFDSVFAHSNCTIAVAGGEKISPKMVYLGTNSNPRFYFEPTPKKDKVYRFSCKTGKDSLYRNLDTLRNYVEWEWQEMLSDTVAPKVSSAKLLSKTKTGFPHDSLIFIFDKPVKDSINETFYIAINKDTTQVLVTRLDPIRYLVKNNKEWPTDATIDFLMGYRDTTLAKADSNGIRDTIVELKYKKLLRFETVSKLKLASLKGTIPNGKKDVIVRLYSIETKNFKYANCDNQGSFKFDDIEEGKFFIEYYYPENGKQTPDAGKLFPFRFGKPWRAPNDTLRIVKGENDLNKLIENLPILPSD